MKHTLFPYKLDGKWVVETWWDERSLGEVELRSYKSFLRAVIEYQKQVKQK